MRAYSKFENFQSRMSRTFPPNLARIMLLGCAALWGGSYLFAKIALTSIPPYWLMFLRLAGSCLIMLALFRKPIVAVFHRSSIVPALVVGSTYFAMMALQTVGLQTIDPGRSSFLTAVYCVLTPLTAWIVLKHRPRVVNFIAAIICLVGVGFVALKPGTLSLSLSLGDWLTLGGAVLVAVNLIFLGIYAQRTNPIALTFLQFLVASVLFLLSALFFEPAPAASWLRPDVVGSFLYLMFGATTLAQIMQNIGLAHVPASSASIIMCTESLFAVGFSALFWGEGLTVGSMVGFTLIFIAVLMSVVKRKTPRPGRSGGSERDLSKE